MCTVNIFIVVLSMIFVTQQQTPALHDFQSETTFYYDHKSMMYAVLLHRACYIKAVSTSESMLLESTATLEKFEIDLLEMAIHQHHSKMTYIELASRSTGIAAMCLNAADLYDMDKRAESPVDCYDLFRSGSTKNGEYLVYPNGNLHGTHVYCDMESDGGGWLVFQRRRNGTVDFSRDWESYDQGFGSFSDEFWLGNFYLHRLTRHKQYEMQINMEDFNDNRGYATYDDFSIAEATSKYRLHISGFHGDRGDSMAYHNNKDFFTKDKDNSGHCAKTMNGGWWYGDCGRANLNGRYHHGNDNSPMYVMWHTWDNDDHNLKHTEMKIRPFLKS